MFGNFFLSAQFLLAIQGELRVDDDNQVSSSRSFFHYLMHPYCCVQFRSTVTVELLYPQEENSCLNTRSRHWKEQGKIDVLFCFSLLRLCSRDLVIFLPE